MVIKRRPLNGFSRLIVLLVLIVQSTATRAQETTPEPDRTSVYIDVTTTHVPQAPDLHALDVVFVDVDQNGTLDVILAVEYGVNRLYLNDGTGKLTWKEGTFGTGAHDTEHVLVSDFNNDGYPDVIFVAEDDQVHQFFLGGPDANFTDVTSRLPMQSEGNGLAVGDVNGDGLPDIVVGNSNGDKSNTQASGQNFLWLNDPKRPGHFIDATSTNLPKVDDDTQDIELSDLNADGHLDMIIANETPPNRLLLNNGKGVFTDASDRLDLLVPMETRQAHIFDANNDGYMDLLLLNLTSNNSGWDKDPQARLLINDGNGRFIDQTQDRMPENRFSVWGGTTADFNYDGYPDLLIGAIEVPGFVPQQLRAYQNDGNGYFKDVTQEVVPQVTIGRHWGMATGDLNGDGKDDIFIGAWGTQARLLLSNPEDF